MPSPSMFRESHESKETYFQRILAAPAPCNPDGTRLTGVRPLRVNPKPCDNEECNHFKACGGVCFSCRNPHLKQRCQLNQCPIARRTNNPNVVKAAKGALPEAPQGGESSRSVPPAPSLDPISGLFESIEPEPQPQPLPEPHAQRLGAQKRKATEDIDRQLDELKRRKEEVEQAVERGFDAELAASHPCVVCGESEAKARVPGVHGSYCSAANHWQCKDCAGNAVAAILDSEEPNPTVATPCRMFLDDASPCRFELTPALLTPDVARRVEKHVRRAALKAAAQGDDGVFVCRNLCCNFLVEQPGDEVASCPVCSVAVCAARGCELSASAVASGGRTLRRPFDAPPCACREAEVVPASTKALACKIQRELDQNNHMPACATCDHLKLARVPLFSSTACNEASCKACGAKMCVACGNGLVLCEPGFRRLVGADKARADDRAVVGHIAGCDKCKAAHAAVLDLRDPTKLRLEPIEANFVKAGWLAPGEPLTSVPAMITGGIACPSRLNPDINFAGGTHPIHHNHHLGWAANPPVGLPMCPGYPDEMLEDLGFAKPVGDSANTRHEASLTECDEAAWAVWALSRVIELASAYLEQETPGLSLDGPDGPKASATLVALREACPSLKALCPTFPVLPAANPRSPTADLGWHFAVRQVLGNRQKALPAGASPEQVAACGALALFEFMCKGGGEASGDGNNDDGNNNAGDDDPNDVVFVASYSPPPSPSYIPSDGQGDA